MKTLSKKCLLCRKQFTCVREVAKFCSSKCRNKWNSRVPKVLNTCQNCGKAFVCYNSGQAACSHKCIAILHYRNYKHIYLEKNRGVSNGKWVKKEEKMYKMPLDHPWREPIKGRADDWWDPTRDMGQKKKQLTGKTGQLIGRKERENG